LRAGRTKEIRNGEGSYERKTGRIDDSRQLAAEAVRNQTLRDDGLR
jgi:hypothetical protein